MSYNWQQDDWPDFQYRLDDLEDLLFQYVEASGSYNGMMEALSGDSKEEIFLTAIVAEAVKTSEIEGEFISRKDVMSSVRNQLGLNAQVEIVKDKRAAGIAEMMLDVRDGFQDTLSKKKLFTWHKMLMKGNQRVKAGNWRSHSEPMQVISGVIGKEKVHFEAPPSKRVPSEMKTFIGWFNQTAPGKKKVIKHAAVRAAIAHLYFETIHPFEDGNGRVGRAIAEKALSQNMDHPILFSISQTIESNKKAYYTSLQHAQRSNKVTEWLHYFISMLLDAQQAGKAQIQFVIKKTRFFDQFDAQINERQLKVVRKMLDSGPEGFEGGMNARKYISITKTSKATATRDLQDLVAKDIFVPFGGGRSTNYQINL